MKRSNRQKYNRAAMDNYMLTVLTACSSRTYATPILLVISHCICTYGYFSV
ncbi:hypothetical protein RintRC_4704 [Richelia intracellularis]|nr:hypothetical protein RintRC_4704 [Richelia intracellularis]